MGCKSTNQRYLEMLIKKAHGEIDQRHVEHIIMNTMFDEKDIYYLYEKFQKLEPNHDSKISNSQLLELPEFKYCPFKSSMIRVFKLEDGNDSSSVSASDSSSARSIKEEIKETERQVTTQRGQIKINNDKNYDLLIKNNNFIRSMDKNQPNASKRKFSYIQGPIIVGKQYIDFTKFCEIMKVFNYRCPVEEKIKFYYALYDVDGDGKISISDLKKFLEIINTKDEKNEEQIGAIENEEDHNIDQCKEEMVQIIMKELITNNMRSYIDYEDFKNLMWNTNIDRTCVIYLEEE